jgi:hypothetical protein
MEMDRDGDVQLAGELGVLELLIEGEGELF